MSKPLTYDDVRAIALALPGVEEGTSYGTPALKVRGKMLARLKEDGDSLVVRISFDEREMLIEPVTFYLTDHYRPYPAMLVRISKVDPGALKRLLTQTWRSVAPKKAVQEFDRG